MSDSDIRALERSAIAGDEAAARQLAEVRRRLGFDNALIGFVERLRGAIRSHYKTAWPALAELGEHTNERSTIELETGPKYVRVVTGGKGSRSVYCFVERATGTLLKPGGWKGPEPKKIPRGSIYNPNPLDGCGPYGVSYANRSGPNFSWAGDAGSAVPVVEPPKPAPEKTRTPCPPGSLLRRREAFGACRILGDALEETGTHFKYRSVANGRVKLAKKDADAPYAGAPCPRPHAVPCTSCRDHLKSRFGPGRCSVHGEPAAPGQMCERCASS
jgi:hypothetical protein